MNLLAIDQGTSATKALVVNRSGDLLSKVEVPVHPSAIRGGRVEQDPDELWDSVVESGRAAVARAGGAVDAVGFANQGETVLVWDLDNGKPLSTALSWQDRRAEAVCRRLQRRGDELATITGLRLDPYFAAPKMAWLRENSTGDGVVTTTDTWLLRKLTGEFVTDATTASRTLLLDLDEVQWSTKACAAFGLDPRDLPRIVTCSEPIGETGVFGARAVVAGAVVDQQAALFAESCLDAGDAKCTYGTGAFMLANTGTEALRSRSGLVACVAWKLGESTTYCLDGQVYTAGAAVSWLQRIGLISKPQELDHLGGSIESSEGVSFVPALAGVAAPLWKPNATASFTGITLATAREHLVLAAVEGIAASVALLARAAESDLGREITTLRADGGLTRSSLLMQTQADLLQTRVEVYPSSNATGLGAAAFARLGIEPDLSPAEVTAGWKPKEIYEPRIPPEAAAAFLDAWEQSARKTVQDD